HGAAIRVNELRQEGEEEEGRLGIEDVDDDALPVDLRKWSAQSALCGLAVVAREDSPDADRDQVRRSDGLDDGEPLGRRRDQRREADGGRGDVDETARRDAQRRDEPSSPALVDALRDDVRDRRARDDRERDGGKQEDRDGGRRRHHGTARYSRRYCARKPRWGQNRE